MLYESIKAEQKLALHQACSALNVSRHAYNAWLQQPESAPDGLMGEIETIANTHVRYGYRRVTHELHRNGIKVNHKRVLQIMRKQRLLCKKRAFRMCTTNSNHDLRTYPNLIKDIRVIGLNQVWVSDITYVKFANNETAYLADIMDRHSRKCIGWQLSRNIDEQLSLDALDMAFKEREGTDLTGLIHHSDRGTQYASNKYTSELTTRGILISMSRKGNPYDNAHAESFFKTLKYEEVYMNEYQSFQDAYQNIKQFIETYNRKRLHSALGYKPPAEYEQQYALKEVVA